MAPAFPPIAQWPRLLHGEVDIDADIKSPTPSQTWKSPSYKPSLLSRDTGDSTSTLSSGSIAGIVIGSIAGFLLLLWVIRSCLNLGAPPQEREVLYQDVNPKRSSHHHHHRRSSNSNSQMRYGGGGYGDAYGGGPRRRSRSTAGVEMPPPVVVRGQSRRREPSATYVYTESDPRRGRRQQRSRSRY